MTYNLTRVKQEKEPDVYIILPGFSKSRNLTHILPGFSKSRNLMHNLTRVKQEKEPDA